MRKHGKKVARRSIPSKVVRIAEYYAFDPGQPHPYEDWKVVFDLAAERRVRAVLKGPTKGAGQMFQILEAMLLSWNFLDEDGNPAPQPREGGTPYCPITLWTPLIQAFLATWAGSPLGRK